MEIFAARLKWLRELKGLTQKQMAELIGMTQSSYSKYEYNLREPNLETLAKIPSIVHESVDFLIGVTDFTQNVEKIATHYFNAESNVAAILHDIEAITVNPHGELVGTRDFEPDNPDSVAAKIERLKKQLPLWEQRMERSREKTLKMLADIPFVKESSLNEIKSGDGWIELLNPHRKEEQ